MKRTVHGGLASAPHASANAADDGLAGRHRIGTYATVICKERYCVVIVRAESIGHLGRVGRGVLLYQWRSARQLQLLSRLYGVGGAATCDGHHTYEEYDISNESVKPHHHHGWKYTLDRDTIPFLPWVPSLWQTTRSTQNNSSWRNYS